MMVLEVAAVHVLGSGNLKGAPISESQKLYSALAGRAGSAPPIPVLSLQGHNGRNCGRCHLCPAGQGSRLFG